VVNVMTGTRRPALNLILWIAILALTAGCAAEPVRKITGNPGGAPPWRMAVLPAQLNQKDRLEASGNLDKKMAERRRALDETRICVALHVPEDSYEVIPLPVVDRAVPPGTILPPGPEAITSAARALDADLVLVPEIHSWKHRYYVLHAVARVGITARIYDGATGSLLFESRHEQVKNQGELKIPAGYLAVVAGPILGLQHVHMVDMCRNVSLKIGDDTRALRPEVPSEGRADSEDADP